MQNRFFMISEEEIKSMAEALAPALSRAPSLQGD